jgi:antitoxin component HigA of HigAB toxin-antitoxin module
MMNLQPIKTEQAYDAALQEIDRLWDAEPDIGSRGRVSKVQGIQLPLIDEDHYEQTGALRVGLPPDRRTI